MLIWWWPHPCKGCRVWPCSPRSWTSGRQWAGGRPAAASQSCAWSERPAPLSPQTWNIINQLKEDHSHWSVSPELGELRSVPGDVGVVDVVPGDVDGLYRGDLRAVVLHGRHILHDSSFILCFILHQWVIFSQNLLSILLYSLSLTWKLLLSSVEDIVVIEWGYEEGTRSQTQDLGRGCLHYPLLRVSAQSGRQTEKANTRKW